MTDNQKVDADNGDRLDPSRLVRAPLLQAGSSELHVFADGSFQRHLELGAVAYVIPQLGLEGSLCERGSHCEQFELSAVLAGLRRLAAVDRTSRPVRIYSDSEFVHGVVRSLSSGSAPVPRKSLDRVRHLYQEAVELVRGRHVTAAKATPKHEDHRRCHRSALGALREAVRSNPEYASRLALAHEEQCRATLLGERAQLDKRVEKLEHALLLVDTRIAALRAACGAVQARNNVRSSSTN